MAGAYNNTRCNAQHKSHAMKRKNYIGYGIAVVFTSVALLLALHHLPPMNILGWELRNVDMLSQLREPDTASAASEAPAPPKRVKPAYVDSCPEGVQCIVDYSNNNRGMVPLYEAMSQCTKTGSELRIAVLGDSFIEGDIVTDCANCCKSGLAAAAWGLCPS